MVTARKKARKRNEERKKNSTSHDNSIDHGNNPAYKRKDNPPGKTSSTPNWSEVTFKPIYPDQFKRHCYMLDKNPERIIFTPKIGEYIGLIPLVPLAMTGVVFAGLMISYYKDVNLTSFLMGGGWFLLTMFLLIRYLYKVLRAKIFDLNNGCFWISNPFNKIRPGTTLDPQKYVKLEDIVTAFIVVKTVFYYLRTSKKATVYELNLYLKDGRQIHLLEANDLEYAKQTYERLYSAFDKYYKEKQQPSPKWIGPYCQNNLSADSYKVPLGP